MLGGDLEGAQVFVPGRLSKNRKPKAIALAASEVQLLREQLLARPAGAKHVFATKRGKAYTRSAFNEHVWWPVLEKVGLKGELHFHDLRHTAISLQAKAGIRPRSSQSGSGTPTAARSSVAATGTFIQARPQRTWRSSIHSSAKRDGQRRRT